MIRNTIRQSSRAAGALSASSRIASVCALSSPPKLYERLRRRRGRHRLQVKACHLLSGQIGIRSSPNGTPMAQWRNGPKHRAMIANDSLCRPAPSSQPPKTLLQNKSEVMLKPKPPLPKSPPSSNSASVVSLRRQTSPRLVVSFPLGTLHEVPQTRDCLDTRAYNTT